MTPVGRLRGGTSSRRRGAARDRLAHPVPRRRHALGIALSGVVVAGIAAAVVWALWFSSLLLVDEVTVEGVTDQQRARIIDVAAVPMGVPLVEVDTSVIEKRVSAEPIVKSAMVRRSWPHAVSITVTTREAAIVVKSGRTLEIADDDGVVFGTVTKAPKGIPVVTASGAAGRTDEARRSALAVLAALPADLRRAVGDMTVTSADLVSFTLGRTTVVWGGAADGPRKVALVRALLPTKATRIDVSAPDMPVTR